MSTVNWNGYVLVRAPQHPNAYADGYIGEHTLKAANALGKPLPKGAEIHHVNGIKTDNRNENLVICESHGYHMLLHGRTNVVRAGGNPDIEKICSICRGIKLLSEFYKTAKNGGGHASTCIACLKQKLATRSKLTRTRK